MNGLADIDGIVEQRSKGSFR